MSRGDIKRFGLLQDLFADASVQKPWGDQIHPTSLEQAGELSLHADEAEARHVPGLELHQDVDVAVGSEVGAKRGSEQREAGHMVPLTERADGGAVDDQARVHGVHDSAVDCYASRVQEAGPDCRATAKEAVAHVEVDPQKAEGPEAGPGTTGSGACQGGGSGKRTYDHAITEFVGWYCSEPRLAFNRTVVLRYRLHLEERRYAPATINLRLAAVRRVAYEAADVGLLSPELAAGIRRVKGVRRLGVRLGNWLTAAQGRRLLEAAAGETLRGIRNHAMLAVFIGCGLRRDDLRRTCARLCHLAGGELDQIRFLLGHVSIQTTERYLGSRQKLRCAVNDKIGLEPDSVA